MKVEQHQDYPATLDKLWTIFGNPEYPEKKYRALGATQFRMLRSEVSSQSIEIELERVSPVTLDKIPDWARKFVKPEQTMRHHTRWKRSGAQVQATLSVVPVGVPVTVEGTGRIQQTGTNETRVTLTFEVGCKIPLVGGKIAQLFADQLKLALEADYAYTLKYLKEAK